jgi:hypothetical protein
MATFACPFCNATQEFEPDAQVRRAWCAGCGRIVPVHVDAARDTGAGDEAGAGFEDVLERAGVILARIQEESASVRTAREALAEAVARCRAAAPPDGATQMHRSHDGFHPETPAPQSEGPARRDSVGQEGPRFPTLPNARPHEARVGAPLCEGHGLSAMLESLIRFTHST